jgi:hypothetical protein
MVIIVVYEGSFCVPDEGQQYDFAIGYHTGLPEGRVLFVRG